MYFIEVTGQQITEILANAEIDQNHTLYYYYPPDSPTGSPCVAFTGALKDLVAFAVAAGITIPDQAMLLGDLVRTTKVGADTLYYFPGLIVKE